MSRPTSDGSDYAHRQTIVNRYGAMAKVKSQMQKVFLCQLLYALLGAAFASADMRSNVPFVAYDCLHYMFFVLLCFVWLPLSRSVARGFSAAWIPLYVSLCVSFGAVQLGVGVVREATILHDESFHHNAWQAAVVLHAFGVLTNAVGSFYGMQLYKLTSATKAAKKK
jgi:hypothetical protein